MTTSLPIDLEALEPLENPSAFSNIIFCISGNVHPKIPACLLSGGAKKMTYPGVSTTHYIAGPDPDQVTMDEAKDIFEVPVVVPDWAVLSIKLGKVVSTDGFEVHHKKLFSSVIVSTSGIKGNDLTTLWSLITYYGGEFRLALTSHCTHLISNQCSGTAYKVAKEKGIHIVCSDWVTDSVKKESLVEEVRYDPALLIINRPPVPVPPPTPTQAQPPTTKTTSVSGTKKGGPSPSNLNSQYNQFSMVRPPIVVPQQNILQNQLLTQTPQSIRQPALPISPMNSLGSPSAGGRLRFPSPNQVQHADSPHSQNQNLSQGQVSFHRAPSPGNQMTPSPSQGVQIVLQGSPQQIQAKPQFQQPQMAPPPSPQQVSNVPTTSHHHPQIPPQQQQKPGNPLNNPASTNIGQSQGAMQKPPNPINQQHMPPTPNQPHQQILSNLSQPATNSNQGPMSHASGHMGSPSQQMNAPQLLPQGGHQLVQNQGQSMLPSGQNMMQNQGQQNMMQNQGQQTMMQKQVQQNMLNQGQQIMIPNQGQPMLQNQMSPQGMPNQGQQLVIQQQRPTMQNPGQMQLSQGGSQMMANHQLQHQNSQHQFQQQIQYQQSPQGMQQFQSQPQMKVAVSQQQFNQMQQTHMAGQQHQVRFPLASPQSQGQQQGHFQVVQSQQGPNRPQSVMGQMPNRGQFQPMQQQNPQSPNAVTMGQQLYRQQQPQGGQMPMFHPIQQQRLQSPPLIPQQQQQQSSGNQIPQQQLKQPHMNQSQMMSPQGQPGQPQHYSVVINQQQQFHQNQSSSGPPHGQQMLQQANQPPGIQQPGMQQQRIQFQASSSRPGSPFTQQQQMDIISQIQREPQIREQWQRMDNTQRQLLMQKLAQRKKEEMLRDMLLRQQHMTQQGPQQNSGQQGQVQNTVQQQQQQLSMPQNIQGISSQNIPGQLEKSVGGQQQLHSQQQAQVGILSPTATGPQPVMSPQQQILIQGQTDPQKASSPLIHPNQQGLVQNHQHQQLLNSQQKVGNPQMSPTNIQRFLAPAPVQTRPQSHGVIGTPQQGQQSSGVVRTQQIFTPQVGQQPVRIHLIQPGQPRPSNMQQQMSNQKIPIMQQQQLVANNNQWHSSQPRLMTPGPAGPQPFPNRLPGPPPPDSPGTQQQAQWTVRPQAQSPQSPGGQSSVSYVKVVNSKTKTALANLLSNRQQGNSGPEPNATSFASALTSTTSTTQAMCPPPPSSVTSQSLPHSAPTTTQSNILVQRKSLANLTNGCKTIQVNSFAGARVATSQSSPTLAPTPARPQYYGHDSQTKIPPMAQFLGCTFWIQQDVERRQSWETLISLCGGIIASEYSPSVTHVVGQTHKFPEFSQALRDGKRIVSPYWISDIVDKKAMVPPYQIMHLPSLFPSNEPPLRGHIASSTNFSNTDKTRLEKLLRILGCKYTPYFTRINTILICSKPEGIKYMKAREWKVPVVNIHFLNELYLGHSGALQMIHSPKYQCFNPDQPLRFDYSLGSNLMVGWKAPIRAGQDVIDNFKTKRPPDNIIVNGNNKRIKLENGEPGDSSNAKVKDIEVITIDDIDDEPLSPPPVIPVTEEIVKKEKTEEVVQEEKEQDKEENNPSNLETKDLEENEVIEVIETKSKTELKTDSVIEVTSENIVANNDLSLASTEKRDLENNVKLETMGVDTMENSLEKFIYPTIEPAPTLPPVCIISGFSKGYKDKIAEKVLKLGGKVTTLWTEATHLILKEHYLTTKLFMALCQIQHIVAVRWISESLAGGTFLSEKEFGVHHDRFEKSFGTTISEVLTKPSRKFLFKGVTFFLTPGNWLLKRDVQEVVESAGGVVDRTHSKSLKHIRDYCSKFPKRSVIISSKDDYDMMESFFMDARRPHLLNLYTDEFVWQCIATQQVKLRQSQA